MTQLTPFARPPTPSPLSTANLFSVSEFCFVCSFAFFWMPQRSEITQCFSGYLVNLTCVECAGSPAVVKLPGSFERGAGGASGMERAGDPALEQQGLALPPSTQARQRSVQRWRSPSPPPPKEVSGLSSLQQTLED